MNWTAIMQTLLNAVIQFGLAYGTAWAGGANTRTAVGVGLGSLATGQAALFQTLPPKKP